MFYSFDCTQTSYTQKIIIHWWAQRKKIFFSGFEEKNVWALKQRSFYDEQTSFCWFFDIFVRGSAENEIKILIYISGKGKQSKFLKEDFQFEAAMPRIPTPFEFRQELVVA